LFAQRQQHNPYILNPETNCKGKWYRRTVVGISKIPVLLQKSNLDCSRDLESSKNMKNTDYKEAFWRAEQGKTDTE
jgi:hypothetical protein